LQLLRSDPGFECILLADSLAGVARLAECGGQLFPLAHPLPVLVELGLAGKRAGCRTPEAAIDGGARDRRAPGLQLAGYEGYEGLLVTDDRGQDLAAVDAFLAQLMAGARQRRRRTVYGRRDPAVGRRFGLFRPGRTRFPGRLRAVAAVRAVLRSGCYLTSDHGTYERMLVELNAREGDSDGLQPALEVWSDGAVASGTDAGHPLTMGKRDVV
jgi:D-serine dehydratase